MKIIGIIGGLSPQSTLLYYKGLNEGMSERLGGHHSAKILLSSVDFAQFVALKEKGDWDTQGALLTTEALRLEKAGADFIILATNTMHKFANQLEAALSIPFLHLADTTAKKIKDSGLSKIGLLGTRYTMEQDFYKDRLIKQGISPTVPNKKEIVTVNDIIYNELCHGIVQDNSKQQYKDIVLNMKNSGIQGIILGCTEITMLIGPDDVNIPIFDTTKIHIEAALDMALSE